MQQVTESAMKNYFWVSGFLCE